jgi:hypothetical protein
MIVIACTPCAFAMRVMPESVTSIRSVQELDQLIGKRSDFWPDKYPCPKCGQMATGFAEREVDGRVLQLMELKEVTPQEAFAALNGLGFPDEQKCSLGAVQELLRGQPFRKLVGTDVVGMERTIVDYIELWDGTKVYFGSGAEGAVIYRITRPVSYANKQLTEATP